MRHYLAVLFIVILFAVPWIAVNQPQILLTIADDIEKAGNELAAVILVHNPRTVAEIKANYIQAGNSSQTSKKVRILLVPGHEPNFGGAEYGDLKERNMTVELGQDLRQLLLGNNRYQVFITRDTTDWNSIFIDYFKNNWQVIGEWEKAHVTEINGLKNVGKYQTLTPSVIHNHAPTDVATRLYGIDKWVNENNIDIVIHIHFNDYPGHPSKKPGDYSGFTIYVPEKQYSNSVTTKALAETVMKRLAKYNPVSDLAGERSGIVEDQDLIAIGSYNTVDAASMLIEYGYIYEPQFQDQTLRSMAIKDLAFQTYLGLQDFFDDHSVVNSASAYDTLLMPHQWNIASIGNKASPEVYALQTALLLNGVYPPSNQSLNDCPRTGTIGPCTKSALDSFQKKYGINGENGEVGVRTIDQLNKLYSTKAI